eukprot:619255-Prorocentrum_minimum.AAC.2
MECSDMLFIINRKQKEEKSKRKHANFSMVVQGKSLPGCPPSSAQICSTVEHGSRHGNGVAAAEPPHTRSQVESKDLAHPRPHTCMPAAPHPNARGPTPERPWPHTRTPAAPYPNARGPTCKQPTM